MYKLHATLLESSEEYVFESTITGFEIQEGALIFADSKANILFIPKHSWIMIELEQDGAEIDTERLNKLVINTNKTFLVNKFSTEGDVIQGIVEADNPEDQPLLIYMFNTRYIDFAEYKRN